MKKIICSNIKCLYRNNDTGECKHNKVVLVFSNLATVNQGRKDILECKTFEIDEEYKKLEEKVKSLIQGSD
jgi:hypothetical protein